MGVTLTFTDCPFYPFLCLPSQPLLFVSPLLPSFPHTIPPFLVLICPPFQSLICPVNNEYSGLLMLRPHQTIVQSGCNHCGKE